MDRRLAAVSAVVFSAITGAAYAATWVRVAIPQLSGMEVYADTSSVVVDEGIRRVWFKYLLTNMRMLELHAYNCKTREMRIEDTSVYLNGELQRNPSNAKPSPWFNPEPESDHEADMQYACKLAITRRSPR
jgi:hypothetical protein